MSLDLPSVDGGATGVVHSSFNAKLRPYQRDGVRFLWDRVGRGAGGILCDDMGLGKTVQVVALLSALYHKTGDAAADRRQIVEMKLGERRVEAALIVCPGSVLCNWEAELERWGQFCSLRYHKQARDATLAQARAGRVEVVLTTYDTVREHGEALGSVTWRLVVADECHKIKEAASGVTRAMKALAVGARVGLTGTALQNKYEELWCLLDWANPGCLGSLDHFRAEFSLPMVRGFRQDADAAELAAARTKQTKLNELKQTWLIRRTKAGEIAAQLPRKTDQVVFCGLSVFQREVFTHLLSLPRTKLMLASFEPCPCGKQPRRAAHQCCRRGAWQDKETKLQTALLQFMQIFLKVANHAALILPESTSSAAQARLGEEICEAVMDKFPELKDQNFLNLSNPTYSGKMEVLDSLLAVLEAEEAKVLLFSHSTKLLNIIEMYAQSKGYSYCRLDGGTKVDARQQMVEDFNRDPSMFLFLISTRAGGLGLNITGANTVIIFDPNWNPAHVIVYRYSVVVYYDISPVQDLQAQDRAYRLGQERDVRVYRLVSAGCIEEVIYLRQLYKQQLAAASIDGCSAKRYFRAVQGDTRRKGELFGIRNLLRVTSTHNRSCLTEDIERRNNEIERKVRNKSKVFLSVADYEMDDAEVEEDAKDPFNIGLEEDLGGNIVYSHYNDQVVGGSRAEEQLSRLARRGGAALEDSQEEAGDTGGSVARYNPGTAGDVPRRVATKQRVLVYGDTPHHLRLDQFSSMAEAAGVDKISFARRVLNMDWGEKLDLIKQQQLASADGTCSNKSVVKLLEKAECDHRDQLRELCVRKLSYNNLSLPHLQKPKQRKHHDQTSLPSTSCDIRKHLDDIDADKQEEEDLSDVDDDLLLAAAYGNIDSLPAKKSEPDKNIIEEVPDLESTKTILISHHKPVKAAPAGQFYKKRLDCDTNTCNEDMFGSDRVNPSKKKFASSSGERFKRKSAVITSEEEEEYNIDNIFSSDTSSSCSNVPSLVSDNCANKRFKISPCENACDTIDDIFD